MPANGNVAIGIDVRSGETDQLATRLGIREVPRLRQKVSRIALLACAMIFPASAASEDRKLGFVSSRNGDRTDLSRSGGSPGKPSSRQTSAMSSLSRAASSGLIVEAWFRAPRSRLMALALRASASFQGTLSPPRSSARWHEARSGSQGWLRRFRLRCLDHRVHLRRCEPSQLGLALFCRLLALLSPIPAHSGAAHSGIPSSRLRAATFA